MCSLLVVAVTQAAEMAAILITTTLYPLHLVARAMPQKRVANSQRL